MQISPQLEFEPLLPIGFHGMDLPAIRELCVGSFPSSATRSEVMAGLENVIVQLEKEGIEAEVWVDGSFLTKKPNPNDSDIIVFVESEVYMNATPEQRKTLDWIKANQKASLRCDCYLYVKMAADSNQAPLNEYMHSYWHRQFGFSRGNNLKGIAVINTGRQT